MHFYYGSICILRKDSVSGKFVETQKTSGPSTHERTNRFMTVSA